MSFLCEQAYIVQVMKIYFEMHFICSDGKKAVAKPEQQSLYITALACNATSINAHVCFGLKRGTNLS
jgi:hypothetical protein